jgi:C1A family cysteine protease
VIPPHLGTFDGSHMPHAVLAVGYDNGIVEPLTNEAGALIIRNSWGPRWGDGGYGCLPYSYVTEGRSRDFWVIF